MRKIVRGTDVPFSEIITDAYGNIITEATVELSISYFVNGTATTEHISMALQQDNSWAATWDSSAADPMLVQWCINATGASKVASQGQFMVVANAANQPS